MGNVIINGKHYSGNNIIVNNNRVIIDGKDSTPESKKIEISINGSINEITIDYCESINIIGNIDKLQTTSGDVYCQDVTGGIKTTSGDIECNNVIGNIKTVSGDIKIKNKHETTN